MTEVRVEEETGVIAPQADPRTCVLPLVGELDAGDTTWSARAAAELSSGCEHLVLDLRNVTFIDSSVIRELLLLHRALPEGGWIHLVYTHHLIARVLGICGVADLFPQFTTVDAALRDSPTRHLDVAEADPGVGDRPSGATSTDGAAPPGHRVWTSPDAGTLTTPEETQWSPSNTTPPARPNSPHQLDDKPGQRF